MPKRNFKATEGLLKDVMTKQAGVIEKAWLEALMNGVDADASHIEFNITDDRTKYSDDGNNMTESEIQKYFEQFGYKDSDIEDKEFGKFRMGRGQIFNFGTNIWRARDHYMVVDIHNDQTTVTLPECTVDSDDSIIEKNGSEYTVDTSGLGYVLLDAEHYDDGVSITVLHEENISDVSDSITEFFDLARFVPWVHGVDLEVNGSQVDDNPHVIEETDNAWFADKDNSFFHRSSVYNKGAFVDEYSLGPKEFNIITKRDLDVTLDRTDILDTDEYWKAIKEEHDEVLIKHLIDKDDLDKSERNWLLEKASESKTVLKMIEDKPLVEDVNGDLHSIKEMSGERLGFAEKENDVASEVMSRGEAVIINADQEKELTSVANSVHSSVNKSDIDEYTDIIDEELKFEMSEMNDSQLSKRRRENLQMLRGALDDLGFRGEIKGGFSNHRSYWKNDEDTVFVHEKELSKKREVIATEVLYKVVIQVAHKGESMTSFDEGHSLYKNLYEYMNGEQFSSIDDYPTVQGRLLNGDY